MTEQVVVVAAAVVDNRAGSGGFLGMKPCRAAPN